MAQNQRTASRRGPPPQEMSKPPPRLSWRRAWRRRFSPFPPPVSNHRSKLSRIRQQAPPRQRAALRRHAPPAGSGAAAGADGRVGSAAGAAGAAPTRSTPGAAPGRAAATSGRRTDCPIHEERASVQRGLPALPLDDDAAPRAAEAARGPWTRHRRLHPSAPPPGQPVQSGALAALRPPAPTHPTHTHSPATRDSLALHERRPRAGRPTWVAPLSCSRLPLPRGRPQLMRSMLLNGADPKERDQDIRDMVLPTALFTQAANAVAQAVQLKRTAGSFRNEAASEGG